MRLNKSILVTAGALILVVSGLTVLRIEPISQKGQIKKYIEDLESNNNEIRRRAFEELCRIGSSAVPFLIETMKDRDRSQRVRVDTLQIVAEQNDPRITQPLIDLVDDEKWRVRYFSIHYLARMGVKRATNNICRRWPNENNPTVRMEIVVACAILAKPEQISVFHQSYKTSDDAQTRLLSAVVLYKILGDIKYYKTIKDAFHGNDKAIRVLAIMTAGPVWSQATFKDERILALLEKNLHDENGEIIEMIQTWSNEIKEKQAVER